MVKVRYKRKLRGRQNMKGGAPEGAVTTTGAALAYGSRPSLTRQKASRNLTGGSSYQVIRIICTLHSWLL